MNGRRLFLLYDGIRNGAKAGMHPQAHSAHPLLTYKIAPAMMNFITSCVNTIVLRHMALEMYFRMKKGCVPNKTVSNVKYHQAARDCAGGSAGNSSSRGRLGLIDVTGNGGNCEKQIALA